MKKQINGLLIIDKPAGLTSHDVVARLRRILGTKKIGHTGTLDPFATGVMVMLVGKATRLARFLDKDEKSYQAVLRFGYETDTGDVEGKSKSVGIQATKEEKKGEKELRQLKDVALQGELLSFIQGLKGLPPKSELLKRVESEIPNFCGEIEQVPPMYSAKKIKGKKLYQMARDGIEVEREPVKVSIRELNLDADSAKRADNELILNISCSAGTYIRTLAEDIGRKIGVGCHLAELRRTNAGPFSIKDALTIEELEKAAQDSKVNDRLISMNQAVEHLPEQKVTRDEAHRIAKGMKIDATVESEVVKEIRITDEESELIAIGEIDSNGQIQPRLVLISEQ